MMEKISLPIPETHGFDMYDGKVLVFALKMGVSECGLWRRLILKQRLFTDWGVSGRWEAEDDTDTLNE
jgi:hypothetical protein